MPYHHGSERKKFEARQDALREQYQQADMPEADIQALYQLDLQEFLSERRYREHTQAFDVKNLPESRTDNSSCLLWVEEVDDPALAERLKVLSQKDLEVLTLYMLEGYSQIEIASRLNLSQQNISRRIARLKKYLDISGQV